MGGFRVVEDRPTPKAVYNARIYALAIVCSFGALTFGYDGAFVGTTIARKSFQDDHGLTEMSPDHKRQTISNLTSVYLSGAFFGALFAWPAMETVGRRFPLQVAAVVFNVGAILMFASNTSLAMQYAGRVITGLAVGAFTAVIPTFISELSPPAIRGQLTGFFEVMYQAGALVGFWINFGINTHMDVSSTKSWKIPMAVQLIPGGLLGIGTFFLKESPAFLLRKGRDEEALAILTWIRKLPSDDRYIQEEVGMVRAVMREEATLGGGKDNGGIMGYLRGAFSEIIHVKSVRHRIIITFFMFLFQNFSGADVALYTGIYGLIKAVGSFIFFLFIVDRSGRRKPWLISAAACTLCLIYLGVFVKIAHPTEGVPLSPSSKAGANAAIFFIMLYSLFWSFGGNGLPWIVSSEIFPIRLRSLTGSFAAMCQWLASFASTMAALDLQQKLKWGLFIFFAGCCAATFVFTYFWIPDTKGIPIECMDLLFSGPSRHMQFRQKKVFPPDGIPPHRDTGLNTLSYASLQKHHTEVSEKESKAGTEIA
ncbi:hypothetical protein VHUM_02104 [Vanrija humicola]|uniref:Major facilitator superfamily (MFS) profile domain-containing protein n=1 Tax=Vanrija humicola TaxID=5417 RepID=A0A7D8Z392_VANHU|nr:hypothetical protein VHUM_02104 [Vanrija humicola]